MAHQIETMMYVGQTPWHGLGVQIEQAPTVADAITAAGLDWEVNTVALTTVDGRPVPNGFATERVTDRKILGVVGPRYRPLQNKDAFCWFQPFLDSGEASLHTAGSLRGGERVWVLAKIGTTPISVNGDDIERYILLSNSHDGTTSIRCGFTPIRVVCANTLALAHNASRSANKLLRVRHSSVASIMLERIRDTMNLVNSQFEATAEQYRLLANRHINAADVKRYVTALVADPRYSLDNMPFATRKLIDEITERMDSPAQVNVRASNGTWWGAYNAYTEYLNHARGRSADNRLNHLWFGAGTGDNITALELALSMSA